MKILKLAKNGKLKIFTRFCADPSAKKKTLGGMVTVHELNNVKDSIAYKTSVRGVVSLNF